ncbi:hypothetical protein [Streptomyces bluensis]|uniref:hypothetical protein n=1 Tax=Streptomyces bluensis TaxID=33897 RepID=UPI00331C925C
MSSKVIGTTTGFLASAALTLALAAGLATGTSGAVPASDEGPNVITSLTLATDEGPNVITTGTNGDEGPNIITTGTNGDEGPNIITTGTNGDEGPNIITTVAV